MHALQSPERCTAPQLLRSCRHVPACPRAFCLLCSRQERAGALAAAAAANAAKRPQTERARQAAAAAGAANGGSDSGRVQTAELGLLDSLAELLGVSVEAAAQQLLGMTPAQRQELRQQYGEQDDPALLPGKRAS